MPDISDYKKFYDDIAKSEEKHKNLFVELALEYFDKEEVYKRLEEVLDEFRRVQGTGTVFDPEAEQAANLLDETLQIARSSPVDTSYETHMSNYAEARRNLAEGNEIQVGVDDFGQIRRASDQDVDAPINSQTATPETNIDVQNRAIQSLRNTLESEDVVFNQPTTVAGEFTPVSSRETIRQLDAEDAAVRATIDCLG